MKKIDENMKISKNTLNQISKARESYYESMKKIDLIYNKKIYIPNVNDRLNIINESIMLLNSCSEKTFNNRIKYENTIKYLEKETKLALTKMNTINEIINNIDWNIIIARYNILVNLTTNLHNYFLDSEQQFNFLTEIEKELKNYSTEIRNIFHSDLTYKLIISERLWILPRLTKEEYEELSKNELNENKVILSIYNKYLEKPEIIKEMIKKWNLRKERKIIIEQIYDNYKRENFETVVIMLTTQIEGIFRDYTNTNLFNKKESEIGYKDMRIKLQEQLNTLSEKENNEWDKFIKKTCAIFLSYIIQPLYKEINFKEDDEEINRHLMMHTGTVNLEKQREMNQIIAIRFFLIVDTVLYMFETLKDYPTNIN